VTGGRVMKLLPIRPGLYLTPRSDLANPVESCALVKSVGSGDNARSRLESIASCQDELNSAVADAKKRVDTGDKTSMLGTKTRIRQENVVPWRFCSNIMQNVVY
jgi:hypothetical protein